MKRALLIVGLLLIVALAAFDLLHPKRAAAPTPQQITDTKTVTPSFDKQKLSLADPASMWVVVNKTRPLNPKDYAPNDLVVPEVPLRVPGNESMQVRKATADALKMMFDDANGQGVELMLSSGYRSYDYQVGLYGGYVSSSSQSEADKTSARPGFSEHQTGLAADIEPLSKNCEVAVCFTDTPEGKWLAANAYKYGFLIRYPADKVPVTGYSFEPWHVRYVGTDLANELHKQSIKTLEEFFSLPAAPGYL